MINHSAIPFLFQYFIIDFNAKNRSTSQLFESQKKWLISFEKLMLFVTSRYHFQCCLFDKYAWNV